MIAHGFSPAALSLCVERLYFPKRPGRLRLANWAALCRKLRAHRALCFADGRYGRNIGTGQGLRILRGKRHRVPLGRGIKTALHPVVVLAVWGGLIIGAVYA